MIPIKFRVHIWNPYSVCNGNVVPLTWSNKPIMENFQVQWYMQKLAKHSIFISDLLHDRVHHPTKFPIDIWNP